jgi:tetratricopeptide (TPR) repeat protein
LPNNGHSEAVASAPASNCALPASSGASAQTAGSERRALRLWTLGLALLAFAVRAPSLFAGFVFDDAFGIEQRAAASWSHIGAYFTTDQSAFVGSNFYRPVLNLWYEFLFAICGTNAAAWHLVSILLHVACALLVFRLALVVIGDRFPAWIAAALFAVHPAHVEAISWASAMGDPLLTLFLLLSVLAFLRWMEQGRSLWWIASFAAGAASIFTKETAVVLPVVLLATALALGSRAKSTSAAAATLPFFAVSAIFLAIRQSVLHSFSHPLTVATTAQMIFTWPAALLFYLQHLFWPSVVVPFYPLQIVKSWSSAEFFGPLAAFIVIAAALGYLLWRAAGWRKLGLCVAWTFVPLAPALYLKALAPFELVHDRFLYAPLVGFCMAAALVLRWAAERIQSRTQLRLLPIVAFALIPLLGIESMSQMVWWQSNKALFTRALTVTPNNPKALVGLATAFIGERRYEEALPMLQQALVLQPGNPNALFALGRIAWERGDDDDAAKYLTEALRIQPRYDMWLHLASIELHRNRLDAAEAAVRQAEALNGSGAGVHIAMGAILLARGDRAGAAQEFREELRYHPGSEPALAGLAQATGQRPE